MRAWGGTRVVVPDDAGLPRYETGRGTAYGVAFFTAVFEVLPEGQDGAWVWSTTAPSGPPRAVTGKVLGGRVWPGPAPPRRSVPACCGAPRRRRARGRNPQACTKVPTMQLRDRKLPPYRRHRPCRTGQVASRAGPDGDQTPLIGLEETRVRRGAAPEPEPTTASGAGAEDEPSGVPSSVGTRDSAWGTARR